VETIGRIRREHFIHGKSIKEIARDLRLSRNTVRKVLPSDETSFSYERRVQPRPKLGRWKEQLDRLLTANVEAAARERLTLIRIFEELRALGYDGGYDAVRRYARSWAKANASATADAFVPLTFAPGEAYQFDWSHEIVVMDGVTTIVKVAHLRLCHSRMMFVRAYPRETQEMVFDAHERAFVFFKGACGRGVYVLGERQRGRPPGRHPRLCRARRDPPGRAHRSRTPALLRPRPDDRFWRGSRALCAAARHSRTGCCQRRWSG
jgi:transposase